MLSYNVLLDVVCHQSLTGSTLERGAMSYEASRDSERRFGRLDHRRSVVPVGPLDRFIRVFGLSQPRRRLAGDAASGQGFFIGDGVERDAGVRLVLCARVTFDVRLQAVSVA